MLSFKIITKGLKETVYIMQPFESVNAATGELTVVLDAWLHVHVVSLRKKESAVMCKLFI